MKKIVSLLMALVLGVSMAGCASLNQVDSANVAADTGNADETPAGEAQTNSSGEKMKMVFIVKSMQFSFMLDMIEGAEQAGKDLGIEVVGQGPETGFSVEEQIQLVEQAITDGVDLVCIVPADSEAITTAVEKCNAAGIPVITPNTKANGGDVLSWVGVDNVEVGYNLGKQMCESISGKGDVVLLEGKPGNSTSEERIEGYKKAIDEYPDVNLIDSQPADFSREAGMTLMENMLQKHAKIDACGSANKDMTMGALEAAKAVGRENEIKFVTFDMDEDVVTAVENGEVYATGDQDPFSQGYMSILAGYGHLNGSTIPDELYLPLTIVTKDNISSYE